MNYEEMYDRLVVGEKLNLHKRVGMGTVKISDHQLQLWMNTKSKFVAMCNMNGGVFIPAGSTFGVNGEKDQNRPGLFSDYPLKVFGAIASEEE